MRKYLCGVVGVLLLSALFAAHAWAGGLILYELGTPDVGLASAGYAARAQDAGTIATNPAGMSRLETSELLLGAQALYADLEFSPNANTNVDGGGGDGGNAVEWFPGGSAFYVHKVSSDLTMGFGLFGNFGLMLEYDADWAGRYLFQEGGLLGLSLMPAVAYRFNDRLSVGAGLNAMYGIFENQAAVNNPAAGGLPDGKLEYEDSDWGFGANLGVLYELSQATRFGLTYCSEISLEFEDTPDLEGLGPVLTGALQAAGLLNNQLGVDIDKPQTVMASVYHELNDRWAVLGNVGWENWSEFGLIGVHIDSEEPKSLTADRDYDDTWHVALGAQYRVSEPWLLSFGVAYDSSMMEDEARTADVPTGDTWRFGLGGQYQWREDLLVGFGYTLAWLGDLEMDQTRGPLSGRIAGDYEDSLMHFLAVNFRWTF